MSNAPSPAASASLPIEVGGFESTPAPTPDGSSLDKREKAKLIKNVTDIQIKDYKWKVESRPKYGTVIMSLLIGQNIFVGLLVFLAFLFGKLAELQPIIGVLITGTLVETAATVNIVINWLFSNTKYPTDKHF